MFHKVILTLICVTLVVCAIGSFIDVSQRRECIQNATNQFELDRCDRLHPQAETVIVL